MALELGDLRRELCQPSGGLLLRGLLLARQGCKLLGQLFEIGGHGRGAGLLCLDLIALRGSLATCLLELRHDRVALLLALGEQLGDGGRLALRVPSRRLKGVLQLRQGLHLRLLAQLQALGLGSEVVHLFLEQGDFALRLGELGAPLLLRLLALLQRRVQQLGEALSPFLGLLLRLSALVRLLRDLRLGLFEGLGETRRFTLSGRELRLALGAHRAQLLESLAQCRTLAVAGDHLVLQHLEALAHLAEKLVLGLEPLAEEGHLVVRGGPEGESGFGRQILEGIDDLHWPQGRRCSTGKRRGHRRRGHRQVTGGGSLPQLPGQL